MGDLCLFMQSQLSLTCCLAKHPCQEINEPGKTSIQISEMGGNNTAKLGSLTLTARRI